MVRGTVELESIPGTLGVRQGLTMDGPLIRSTHTHTRIFASTHMLTSFFHSHLGAPPTN